MAGNLPTPRGPMTMIGTMNMLGDAYNPFEFSALDDAQFTEAVDGFEAAMAATTWADLRGAGLDALAAACDADGAATRQLEALASGGEAWAVFAEDHYKGENNLKMDNKLHDHRVNLLVFAMRRVDVASANFTEDQACPSYWQLVSDEVEVAKEEGRPAWWSLLKRCCAEGATYKQSPNLLAWDLLCNVVAARQADLYLRECRRSYLNPVNNAANAATFVGAVEDAAKASGASRCVLGLQEFPEANTARGETTEAAFAKAGYTLVHSALGCCTIAYRGFDDAAEVVARGEGESPIDVMAVMKSLTRKEDGSPVYDAKTTKTFEGTTARKCLSVRLGGIAFHAMHVKEPKNAASAALLSQFIAKMVAAAGPGPFVVLVDTNLPYMPLDDAFRAANDAAGFQTSPYLVTTSKRRSRVHGQCYDMGKCHTTVAAAKDKFVCGARDTLYCLPEHPALGGGNVTLPKAEWPSDHALVVACFAPA